MAGVILKIFRGALAETNRLSSNHVLERAALGAGENRGIDRLSKLGLTKNQAAARTTQRLVRRGGHEIGVRNRRRMDPRCHEAGDVGDVRQQERTVFFGDLSETGEVDFAGISRGADGDHLRFLALRHFFHLVVINPTVRADAVMHDGVKFAGKIRGVAVRQVSAVRKIHGKNLITRLDRCEIDGRVRLAAGVRLDVRMIGAEKDLRTIDCQLLDGIDDFATTIPAFARITFGILIGQHAPLGFHDGRQGEIL